jgi:hypothetical protein
MNYFPRLASNCNPPNLGLPSSWDYRWVSLASGFFVIVNLRSDVPTF